MASKSAGTRKIADKPTHFHVENFPSGNFLVVPKTSSEQRRYIPIGFMSSNDFASDLVFVVPNATLYHFGILTSSIHMAWLKTVGGRLKSDYRHSKDVVYNNFPWPTVSTSQRQAIEQTAQQILDARAKYPAATLADLYDELTMPADLRAAHKKNDRAVAVAYSFADISDDEPAVGVALLKLYKNLCSEVNPADLDG